MVETEFEHRPSGLKLGCYLPSSSLSCTSHHLCQQSGGLPVGRGMTASQHSTLSLPFQVLSTASDLRPNFYTNVQSGHKCIDFYHSNSFSLNHHFMTFLWSLSVNICLALAEMPDYRITRSVHHFLTVWPSCMLLTRGTGVTSRPSQ